MGRVTLIVAGAISLLLVANGCEPPKKTASTNSQQSAAIPPDSTETTVGDPKAQFEAAFRKASEAKSVDAMLKLYCFDGADAQMQQTVRENVYDEMAAAPTNLEWLEADPAKHGPREEGGIRWKPSLPVVAILKVSYPRASPGQGLALTEATHAVGIKGGKYLITVPVRE